MNCCRRGTTWALHFQLQLLSSEWRKAHSSSVLEEIHPDVMERASQNHELHRILEGVKALVLLLDAKYAKASEVLDAAILEARGLQESEGSREVGLAKVECFLRVIEVIIRLLRGHFEEAHELIGKVKPLLGKTESPKSALTFNWMAPAALEALVVSQWFF